MSTLKKIAIVLDFDRTLFDTDSFKLDLSKSLVSLGVTSDLFFKLYSRAVIKNEDGVSSYNVDKHIILIAKTVKSLSKRKAKEFLLNVAKNSRSYLYPETVKFLKKLRSGNFYLILLTHSHKSLQLIKVHSSGIVPYFSEVIILDGKVKASLFKKFTKKFIQVFFISDHTGEIVNVQNICPKVELVMKLGGYGKLSEAKANNIPALRNLLGIEKYIIKCLKNNKNS